MKPKRRHYDVFDFIINRYFEEIDFLSSFFEFSISQSKRFRTFINKKITDKIDSKDKVESYGEHTLSIIKNIYSQMNDKIYNHDETIQLYKEFFKDKDVDDIFLYLEYISIYQSPHKYNRSICHLSTIHLNTLLENFMSDYFRILFRSKKSLLKSTSNESKLSYNDVVDSDEYKDVLNKMIDIEIDKISHLSIPKLAKYLKDKFKIDIKNKYYGKVEELSLNRHELVHSYISYDLEEEFFRSNFDSGNLVDKESTYYQIGEKYVENIFEDVKSFMLEFNKTIKKRLNYHDIRSKRNY